MNELISGPNRRVQLGHPSFPNKRTLARR